MISVIVIEVIWYLLLVNMINVCYYIFQALSYAKEAHYLRSKLLRHKFEYSMEKMTYTCDEGGETIERIYYGIQTFRVNDIEAAKDSENPEGCALTPWNVLSCYLESILQVFIKVSARVVLPFTT